MCRGIPASGDGRNQPGETRHPLHSLNATSPITQPRATGYRLQATGYRLQATGYRLNPLHYQGTGYKTEVIHLGNVGFMH